MCDFGSIWHCRQALTQAAHCPVCLTIASNSCTKGCRSVYRSIKIPVPLNPNQKFGHSQRNDIMKWTDTQRIAEELYDLHGDSIDPKTVRFTQLRDLIMALPDFDDDPARCGERILEAVQQAWIEETE